MYEYDFTPVPFKPAGQEHRANCRIYQGIPSITITKNGRLFFLMMTAEPGSTNYALNCGTWSVIPMQYRTIRAISTLFTITTGTAVGISCVPELPKSYSYSKKLNHNQI